MALVPPGRGRSEISRWKRPILRSWPAAAVMSKSWRWLITDPAQARRRRHMIDVNKVLAVAQTEGRLTRRLTRYWLFLALAFGGGLMLFFYYSAIHAFGSAFSPTIGLINPRYLVSAIGSVYLTGFTIGIIFLGFDVRAP